MNRKRFSVFASQSGSYSLVSQVPREPSPGTCLMLPLFISPGQSNGSSDERRKRKPHTVTPTLKVLSRGSKQLVLHIELFSSK